MANYLLRRIIQLVPVLLGISVITFGLMQLVPGDPAEMLIRQNGIEPTEQAVQALRVEMGLDKPLHIQFAKWFWGVIRLDLGQSYHTGLPVFEELTSRLPATLELALGAITVMLVIAIPLGILSAVFQNSIFDHFSRLLALSGASFPGYWLGLLLIFFFSVKMSILPVMGRGGLYHLIMPAVTLGFGMSATYIRLLRASLLEVMGQEFIIAARARGITEKLIIGAHALRHALLPVITAFGISLGYLLGGTAITETILAWPGLGKFCVVAIFNRDYPVLQAYVLMMAVAFVTINLLVDISYAFLDPRIRLAGREKD